MTTRGRLQVLLGAAPGVGKTYSMLETGRQLRDDGIDVVIGIVETHGREATARMTAGLETVPRRQVTHRGVVLEELDLDALLERAPQVALVDELAHTNAPGSQHEKRWEDVETLLEAGIDVLSTLNIQHIESLNDVVEQITGVPQRETVPDSFLRHAAQVEVIDLAPQALRDRLSGGFVYPAERIDAALSNYFRLGNLTALRELALLWLADEVDQALQRYREEHHIDSKWEARERVLVALTGGEEGETLLRRGARTAARSAGGELIAVHVTVQDGLRSENPAALAHQRALVEKLGGTYHQVVGDDIAETLIEFARSVNATQLVLGASRRGWLSSLVGGRSVSGTVIRNSGEIDVHIVNHRAAAGRFSLPPVGGTLSRGRRMLGYAIALIGCPALTALLTINRSADSITTDVLTYQLLVVVVALAGGIYPALLAALMCGLALDFFFIEPLTTVTIASPSHVVALLVYMLIAALVSFVVDRSVRYTRAARRSAAESELIQTIAGSVIRGDSAIEALVDRTREAFQLDAVRVRVGERVIAAAGEVAGGAPHTVINLAGGGVFELFGGEVPSSERRLLAVITAQLEAALEHQRLSDTAEEIGPIAESDRVRGALLSALSHDLRRPLAAATTAVGALRTLDGSLSAANKQELIETADESLTALGNLVNDLLDVSRLQAGVLRIATSPIDPAEAIAPALDELGAGPSQVQLGLGHGDALVEADPVLLQRVIVNLLTNALRHSVPGDPVTVTTSTFDQNLEIRIIDHGPGVSEDRHEDIFVPFQRLGDTDNSSGLGLGLALSRGFVEAMHGTLTPEQTPGGGLTMVISLGQYHSAPAEPQ